MVNDLEHLPEYYRDYSWEGKHKLFGYPADTYPNFSWICSLENRFIWLRENSQSRHTAAIYLIKEMIEWGGSQHGSLQRFSDGLGEVSLYQLIQEVILNLDEPVNAIRAALALPGLGLPYASRLLRFLKPEFYGVLDSRISSSLLGHELLPKINDGSVTSMVAGYVAFHNLLNRLGEQLQGRGIEKPHCALSKTGMWRPAEIGKALVEWTEKH